MKPKIAFFDFASCEGCQLAVLNCEDIFLDILGLVDIVEFREALSEKASQIDIAFVEGSIHREEDSDRLREIRVRSKVLVALGSCACMGNVQARSNCVVPEENFQRVYGRDVCDQVQTGSGFQSLWAHIRVRAVDEIVAVDYRLRGCPMVPDEFIHLVKSLIIGAIPNFPANPVCVECKMHENACVFSRGETCMGQITWGGCHAVCINNGYRCDGCRGFLSYANIPAHKQLLRESGLLDKEIENRYRLFCSTGNLGVGGRS